MKKTDSRLDEAFGILYLILRLIFSGFKEIGIVTQLARVPGLSDNLAEFLGDKAGLDEMLVEVTYDAAMFSGL